MNEGLRYAICASSESDIRAHLIACDAQFQPPLSTRVDIAEYAEKLKRRALAFEAWDGTRLVGLVAAYIADQTRSCYITNVSVISEFTGKGVARTLLNQVVAHALRHNLSEVTLEVAKQSVEAVRMYASLGFRPAEDRNDRLLMRCKLDSAT